MHQQHNIPWSTISNHLKVHEANPFLEGRNGTNIFRNAITITIRHLPTEHTELNHFLRKFIQSITDFSTTERRKYPHLPKYMTKGKVFSDTLLNNRPRTGSPDMDPINPTTQSIESWLKHVPKTLTPNDAYGRAEEYADVIKILLTENELAPLLMLAKHPSCNPAALFSFGQSFNFGWSPTIDIALFFYIFLNIVGNTPKLLEDNKYTRMELFQKKIVYQLHRGGQAGNELHMRFWASKLKPADPLYSKTGPITRYPAMTVDFFEDMAYLKEYLNACWRMLYCADMLMRECGIDSQWDARIVSVFEEWGFEGKYREEWWANSNVEGREGQWIKTFPVEFGPRDKEAAEALET